MAIRSKLTVILHADVVGSTALVQKDEHVSHEVYGSEPTIQFLDTVVVVDNISKEITEPLDA